MKNWLLYTMTAAAALLVSSANAESPVTRTGTSILHYTTRNPLVSTEADTNAAGKVTIQYKEQGSSIQQKFTLTLANLDPETEYSVFAQANDDGIARTVASFTTDSRGKATVKFSRKSNGKGRPNQPAMPSDLNPLALVNVIGVAKDTNTVAYAWINTSGQFEYMVKRNLADLDLESDPKGSVSLIANQNAVNFRLRAGLLTPSAPYHFALNGVVLSSHTSDENGRLEIRQWPTNAPAILDLRTLRLLDSGNQAVLGTNLPK